MGKTVQSFFYLFCFGVYTLLAGVLGRHVISIKRFHGAYSFLQVSFSFILELQKKGGECVYIQYFAGIWTILCLSIT